MFLNVLFGWEFLTSGPALDTKFEDFKSSNMNLLFKLFYYYNFEVIIFNIPFDIV